MATTDIYKGVLYNDGEALTTEDLNEMQAFGNARLLDQILAGTIGKPDRDGFMWLGAVPAPQGAPYLYGLQGGAGYLDGGAGALEVVPAPGVILQAIATADGTEAKFIPYYMSASDFAFTLAAADATNPRIDIVQVKLEYVNGNSESRDFEDDTTELLSSQSQNKTRRVQATFSVKQGTPAATPTFPTLDAGYVALGAAYIPATYAAVFFGDQHLMDLRLLPKVRSVDILAMDLAQDTTAGLWNLVGSAGQQILRTNSAAGGTVWARFPLRADQRVLSIEVFCQQEDGIATDWTGALLRRQGAGMSAGGSMTTVANVFTAFNFPNSTTDFLGLVTFAELRDALTSTTPRGTANAAGLGTPIWGNGHPAGVNAGAGAQDMRRRLVLELTSNAAGSDIFGVRVTYCEGF